MTTISVQYARLLSYQRRVYLQDQNLSICCLYDGLDRRGDTRSHTSPTHGTWEMGGIGDWRSVDASILSSSWPSYLQGNRYSSNTTPSSPVRVFLSLSKSELPVAIDSARRTRLRVCLCARSRASTTRPGTYTSGSRARYSTFDPRPRSDQLLSYTALKLPASDIVITTVATTVTSLNGQIHHNIALHLISLMLSYRTL